MKCYVYFFWDHDGNFISFEQSNPFDGTFSPNDWHRMEVEAIVPREHMKYILE